MSDNNKLSPLAKYAKSMIKDGRSGQYKTIRSSALALVLTGFFILILELILGRTAYLIFAVVFFLSSLALFQRAGFMELIEKEYKK